MELGPYLNFNGQCAAAFKFYEKTFWSPGFGMVVDRFGIPWMVNSEPAA